MTFSSIIIFANSASGSLNKASLEFAVAHIGKFIPTEIVYTKSIEEAKSKIKDMALSQNALPVACGGDGSISFLLNNINISQPFGIIPQGTANVVAEELGIPTNVLNACKGLLTYAVKDIDVGICNDSRFLFAAGIGFDAEAAYSVSKKLKKSFGQYAYYVSTILSFLKRVPVEIHVEADSQYVCKGEWFLAMNMRRYGGNLFFCPTARYDDGFLNAIVLKKLNLKSLMKILCYAKGKRSFPNDEAVEIKAKNMRVIASAPIKYQLDGEVYNPRYEFELSVYSEKAKILVP